ncbi:hypothetical protein Ocin01_18087 [Orchesella cincta]|uniref:Uncharacterized protein n=1 Tax=Orchesella cincta TaxID=48709 RepID=A0A1D2M6K5_ORCCI|nr:hypothetical protein Ocin01_18087 [Orchesella cincta]
MSAKGVEALLKFIYYSNVDDPMSSCSVALELLKGGHQSYAGNLSGQKYAWFDIDTALMLYFWTLKVDGNEDLKWKALRVIKSKGDDLEGSTVFEKLLKEDTKTATKLIAQCFKI